jgi:hypothetical protein
LLLFSIIKTGYKYSQSALNPGVRVSFIEDVQRAVLAMGIIALSPTMIALLIGINDGFVHVCGNVLNNFAYGSSIENTAMSEKAGMFEVILAAPAKTLLSLINLSLGLKGLDDLIFNGNTNMFANIFAGVNTGNIFADVVLDSSLVGFNLYFNAVYTIRFWMITAAIVATPIVAWVWVLTAERTVLEVFLAEIVQSVFLQSSHALSLGIFMSIAGGVGAAGGGDPSAGWLSGQLVHIGVFVAGFAGSICVAVLVVMGFRFITTSDERSRSDAKEGVKKALIGLVVVGLCTAIASFIAVTLSGSWGVRV